MVLNKDLKKLIISYGTNDTVLNFLLKKYIRSETRSLGSAERLKQKLIGFFNSYNIDIDFTIYPNFSQTEFVPEKKKNYSLSNTEVNTVVSSDLVFNFVSYLVEDNVMALTADDIINFNRWLQGLNNPIRILVVNGVLEIAVVKKKIN